MVVPLGSTQPVFAFPVLEDIASHPEDAPVDGPSLVIFLHTLAEVRTDEWRRRSLGL